MGGRYDLLDLCVCITEPKWPLFWLEKVLFFWWRVQTPTWTTNRFQRIHYMPAVSYCGVYVIWCYKIYPASCNHKTKKRGWFITKHQNKKSFKTARRKVQMDSSQSQLTMEFAAQFLFHFHSGGSDQRGGTDGHTVIPRYRCQLEKNDGKWQKNNEHERMHPLKKVPFQKAWVPNQAYRRYLGEESLHKLVSQNSQTNHFHLKMFFQHRRSRSQFVIKGTNLDEVGMDNIG